ncbi:MAG: MFS transporter [Chloroflexota bacterium]
MRRRRGGIFYGWWIVAAAAITTVFASMTYQYGNSVFYKVLIDYFGWTRTQLAAAVSLSRLESGFLGGIEGFIVDKYGPRLMILVGTSIMSLGFIMLSRVNSLLEYYLIFIGLVVVGQSLSRGIPLDATVATWFIRRRGTAFGLLRGATAVGAAGVVIVAWFIAQYGWRAAFVATGIGTFALGIPTAFVMRRRPEHYGMLPDGDTVATKASPGTATAEGPGGSSSPAAVATGDEDIGMTIGQALRSWSFWAISIAFAIRVGVSSAVTLHAIPLVEDMGYSSATAAAVLGSIGVVSVVGRLGGGVLNDIIGTKRVAVGSVCTLAISLLILAQAHTLWQVMLFVAIYAPSYGASAATVPAMKGDYFGRMFFGTILGLAGILQTGGSMFGPVFAAWVFDVTGSYRLALLIFAGVLMISVVLFLSLKTPRYSRASVRASGHA